jgi:hypothetical protein
VVPIHLFGEGAHIANRVPSNETIKAVPSSDSFASSAGPPTRTPFTLTRCDRPRSLPTRS